MKEWVEKIKRRKNIFLTLLGSILLISIGFGVTYAYLIANAQVTNQFTVGETDGGIDEPYEPPAELKPGEPFVKEPSYKNTGNLPCFVRMRADFSSKEMEEVCDLIGLNLTDWDNSRKDTDGYYYYKHLIQPGEATKPLFEKLQVQAGTDDAKIKAFELNIYAEAVQHEDHNDTCPYTGEHLAVWQK